MNVSIIIVSNMSYRFTRLVKTVFQRELNVKLNQNVRICPVRLNSNYSKPKISGADTFRTETDLVYPSDPDLFGTLAGRRLQELPEDEGDLKEKEYIENRPLRSQKLSTKQYADLIKQYVKYKRIKEALDVLEVKMLKEDRVQPENYIYNILIGACADVGYTKKAFKLYNDMKGRALRVTGDTYTCLFNACANSPWPKDGIQRATHLRQLMKEKGIEPNLTNYNSMIKAFGRCGDLSTAFEIIDEMVRKKIKIRVHTFNFLLQACITDKEHGLRHAIIVWRKMLLRREKPNIYMFNLMLKCVKECNFGTQEDIKEAVSILSASIAINQPIQAKKEPLQIQSNDLEIMSQNSSELTVNSNAKILTDNSPCNNINTDKHDEDISKLRENVYNKEDSQIQLKFIPANNDNSTVPQNTVNSVPNLLSKNLQIDEVIEVKEVVTPQERFEFIGGQSGFLEVMKEYNVGPDFKTMAQMVLLIPATEEAENKLMETIREHGIWVDMEFYNTLIRKRCLRLDYKGALAVKEMIDEENKYRKKKHPMRKRLILKYNLLTYGALAMTCETKEDAIKMIAEMEENQLKINIQILGAMLSQAATRVDFDYARYIMEHTKSLGLKPNVPFLDHLRKTGLRGRTLKQRLEAGEGDWTEENLKEYKKFLKYYRRWLQEIAQSDSSNLKADGYTLEMESEHPWSQFRENQPETIQRQKLIEPPKRFFKRKKHPGPYRP